MIQFKNEQVCVFESALFRTTSSVIETSDLILLVDPTWLPQEIEIIRQYVEKMKGEKPLYLFFTHSDYDHIIAVNAFPEGTIIASEAFANNPDKSKILEQINDFDDENYIKRTYPITYPDPDLIISGDEQLVIGDTILSFYQAPGHNRDGMFLVLEREGIWVCGDYLSNIEFPYIYHSSLDYERTLDKAESILQNHEIKVLIPGHGDVTTSASEMQTRITESRDYIKKLRACLINETDFPLEELWKKYDFPKVMTRFHQGNIDCIKKELAS